MAIIFAVSLIPLPFTVLTFHSSLNGEAPLYSPRISTPESTQRTIFPVPFHRFAASQNPKR